MCPQGALPAFPLQSRSDLVLMSMVLHRENEADVYCCRCPGRGQEGAQRERKGGRRAAHALCPHHGAWVEGGSSDNPPSHRGALPALKTLSHPPLEMVHGG